MYRCIKLLVRLKICKVVIVEEKLAQANKKVNGRFLRDNCWMFISQKSAVHQNQKQQLQWPSSECDGQ